MRVFEVNRPDRRQRRAKGKSDALDAYAAADAVLSGRACATPKLGTGIVEAIRAPHTTRAGAVKARTAAMNELRSLLVTAPAEVRDGLRGLAPVALVRACARLRPTGDTADPQVAVRAALRALARRHEALTGEIADLDAQLRPLVERACPALIAIHGVGYETAAQCSSPPATTPTGSAPRPPSPHSVASHPSRHPRQDQTPSAVARDAEASSGGRRHDPRLGRAPLSRVWDQFALVKQPAVSAKTWSGYVQHWQLRIFPRFGGVPVDTISRADVQDFVDGLEVGPWAKASTLRLLRAVLEEATTAGSTAILRLECQRVGFRCGSAIVT